jgi:hypothetical protein
MSIVQLMRRKKDYKREEDITRLERFKRGFWNFKCDYSTKSVQETSSSKMNDL